MIASWYFKIELSPLIYKKRSAGNNYWDKNVLTNTELKNKECKNIRKAL